ncbi:MAG: protein kinase [Muribaculaceae bacterium]|nr:protein kinase [Muribaculaceae bacterium]
MENSAFSADKHNKQSSDFIKVKELNTSGATSKSFKVRRYGKLLFLKQPYDINNSQLQDAFRKEFEVGFNLDHNGLVRYVAFDDETCSIFTEWIEGATLSQFIKDNPDYFRDQSNCTRFITQLLDAVGYLHSHSVLHLDLKPDNIMITDIDCSVKIIDLGFSLTNCFDTTSGFTPLFAAPEQIENGALDCRSDIYAIGRIIEHIFNQINAQPPRHIKRFIAQCTATDHSDRYQSATAAIKSLQSNRFKGIIITATILLALAIIGVVTYLLLRNQNTNDIDSAQSIANIADTTIVDTISPKPIEINHIDSTSTATTITPIDTIKQITPKPTAAPQVSNIPITPPSVATPPTPKPNAKKLSPAEKLDSAEAQMGMFATIRGHYPIKKEWFARQYRLFDSLRTEYLATNTAQQLGNRRIHTALRELIERDKHIVAKKFPGTDIDTILAVAHDINIVIVYLCYSDSRIFSGTNEMNHQFYDFARRKAALLK